MADNRQYIKQIKLIFLHIPKTGGSFVEKILQKILQKHYNTQRRLAGHYSLNMFEENIFYNYTILAVVRNPYDRLFSCYNYLVRKNWYINKFPNTYIILNKPKNFIEFVNNLYELFKTNKLPWMKQNKKISLNSNLYNLESTSKDFLLHLYPQYIFFSDRLEDKKIHILKYENLDTDFEKFNNSIFYKNTLIFNEFKDLISKIYIKKSYNIPSIYPTLIYKIKEIYYLDFEKFNYNY